MTKFWSTGLAVAAICMAQESSATMTIQQIQAALNADLRGTSEEAMAPDPFMGSPQTGAIDIRVRSDQTLPAQTVSAERLRHRVPKDARKAFESALKKSRKGDHLGAESQLKIALARDPSFAVAYLQIAAEYGSLGQPDDAEDALKQSMRLDPSSWVVHYDLAILYLQKGDPATAERSARRAFELSPNSARVNLLLGLMLWPEAATRDEGLKDIEYAAQSLKEAKEALQAIHASE